MGKDRFERPFRALEARVLPLDHLSGVRQEQESNLRGGMAPAPIAAVCLRPLGHPGTPDEGVESLTTILQ